jgi:CDK inhibitor PHO81
MNYKGTRSVCLLIHQLALKKIIKGVLLLSPDDLNVSPVSRGSVESSGLDQTKNQFFFKVERELEKVNTFYVRKQSELQNRLRALTEKKESLFESDKHSYTNLNILSLKEALAQFQEDLAKLQVSLGVTEAVAYMTVELC